MLAEYYKKLRLKSREERLILNLYLKNPRVQEGMFDRFRRKNLDDSEYQRDGSKTFRHIGERKTA